MCSTAAVTFWYYKKTIQLRSTDRTVLPLVRINVTLSKTTDVNLQPKSYIVTIVQFFSLIVVKTKSNKTALSLTNGQILRKRGGTDFTSGMIEISERTESDDTWYRNPNDNQAADVKCHRPAGDALGHSTCQRHMPLWNEILRIREYKNEKRSMVSQVRSWRAGVRV